MDDYDGVRRYGSAYGRQPLSFSKNRQYKMQEFQVGHGYSTLNEGNKLILSSFLSVLIWNSLCTKSTVLTHLNLRACEDKNFLMPILPSYGLT